MNRKILVPLDGSETAFRALDFACGLAAAYEATLLLLHVGKEDELPEALRQWVEVPQADGPPEWVYESSLPAHILRRGEERARHRGTRSVRREIRDGEVAKVIVDAARGENVELIVMGTRGRTDLRHLVLGGVAQRVSQLAAQTVVTVS